MKIILQKKITSSNNNNKQNIIKNNNKDVNKIYVIDDGNNVVINDVIINDEIDNYFRGLATGKNKGIYLVLYGSRLSCGSG